MTEKKRRLKVISGMKFYIPSDIAKLLDLTEFSIRCYLRDKKLKGIKIGGRWYISEANFKAFLGGGRFFDQSDDKIMDQINYAIKLTFESNVKWLAYKVKELIIDDLKKSIKGNLKKIDQGNIRLTEFVSDEVTKQLEKKTEAIKREFQKV